MQDLAKRRLPSATANAINRTKTEARKQIASNVHARTQIPLRKIRKRLPNKKGRASFKKLEAIGFAGTWTIRDSKAAKKSNRSTFTATMPSGHTAQFYRVHGTQVKGLRGKLGSTSRKAIQEGWKRQRIKDAEILDISKPMNAALDKVINGAELRRFYEKEIIAQMDKQIQNNQQGAGYPLDETRKTKDT